MSGPIGLDACAGNEFPAGRIGGVSKDPARSALDYQVGGDAGVERRARRRLDVTDLVLTVFVCALLGTCALGLLLSSLF